MPKRKSNRSARKRFKVTGTGKVMRTQAGKSHLMGSFSGKRVRKLRRKARVASNQEKVVKEMLLA